jgi:hypothetical protein
MSALPGLIMSCDATLPEGKCLREVRRAPRIVIPAAWNGTPQFPLRIMTVLHYCEEHRYAFDLRAYLSDDQKRRIERQARETRGADFKPDFDRARCELILVTIPEYREFMQHVGVQVTMAHG